MKARERKTRVNKKQNKTKQNKATTQGTDGGLLNYELHVGNFKVTLA